MCVPPSLQDEMARAFPRDLEQTEGFLYSFEFGLELKGRVYQKCKKKKKLCHYLLTLTKKKHNNRGLRINIANMLFLG